MDYFSNLLLYLFLGFTFIIPIAIGTIKGKGKQGALFKWSVIFLLMGSIVLLKSIVGASINTSYREGSSSSTNAADGFTIEEFELYLDVDESNSVDVTEYITVDFFETGHHGIYVSVPYWLEYTDKNGNTESRQSKIDNVKVLDENFSTEEVDGKLKIKIGDGNTVLPIGEHTYKVSYTYDMGSDPYEGFDEFIFHAYGDHWRTPIKNASLVINLPKEFDDSDIKFFADKYRKRNISPLIDYEIDGSTIKVDLSNVEINNALTVDIVLPDGYFTNASNNYGTLSLTFCLICIGFAIIAFIIWTKNGKDLDDVPETVEFYPPDNLDASEIGYLYKKDTGRKLSIALIIELASKGFIKIIESEDKKTQTIVKTNPTDVDTYIKREIKIVKLKEYKKKLVYSNPYAYKFMKDNLPKGVNECVVTSNFESFYTDSKSLIDGGYIKIVSDTINNYTGEQIEKLKNELKGNEFKDKPKMTQNEEAVYNKLFEKSDSTVLSENTSFYKVFSEVADNVSNSFDDKINDLEAYKYMLFTSIGFFICMMLYDMAFCIIEDLDPKLKVFYTLAVFANIFTLIISVLMKRKNLYGEQMKSRINGFKNYLEVAEKEQIEALVEKNPNYFYNILPYAYVLGVSKKWVEKFENIPIPQSDMGNFDYVNIDSIDSLSDSVYVPSSSGSSGCGGGGCSSCGGGCSSCGGGGSW